MVFEPEQCTKSFREAEDPFHNCNAHASFGTVAYRVMRPFLGPVSNTWIVLPGRQELSLHYLAYVGKALSIIVCH